MLNRVRCLRTSQVARDQVDSSWPSPFPLGKKGPNITRQDSRVPASRGEESSYEVRLRAWPRRCHGSLRPRALRLQSPCWSPRRIAETLECTPCSPAFRHRATGSDQGRRERDQSGTERPVAPGFLGRGSESGNRAATRERLDLDGRPEPRSDHRPGGRSGGISSDLGPGGVAAGRRHNRRP